MKRTSLVTALFLAAIAATALPRSAHAEGLFYVTGAIANASTDLDIETDFQRLIDDDDEGWNIGVGFKIGKRLAIEGTYHDLGTAQENSSCNDPRVLCIALVAPVEVDSTAVTVSVLPHWPITESFSVYGRLGIAAWDSDINELFGDFNVRNLDDEELIFGAGVRLAVAGPLGVHAELSRIGDSFETVSLGATLGF